MINRLADLMKMQEPKCDVLLFASGTTVPTDGTAGYETGCIFQHTDGAAGTSFYINEGTATASAFAAVAALTAAQEAALTANTTLLSATAGTVAASKAVVVDANKDALGFRNVTVAGTLGVTGVTTLTAAPKLTATTAGGAITLTMTNAPAGADAGKAAPIYLTVTVDATTYVVPAWPLA
jgi:hypothetical protein